MRRADRLFQLVQVLRNRRFATARGLAENLGVSERTIYRDVQDLQRSGVPIRGEAGVGYSLERGHELPPMRFTAEEVAALVLGSRMVQAWGDADLADAARSVLTKVESTLPEPLRQVLLDTPLFAPGTSWAAAKSTELGELRRAIDERRKVRLRYCRADGTESERTVLPVGLYFFGAKWLLAAWCELREEYRSFRIDRMLECQALPEHFQLGEDADLAGFLARSKE